MKSVLSHVALLLPSINRAAQHLKTFDFPIGPAQEWESEGTREIYVGDMKSNSGTILLMEPVKEGAYTRAMRKRGPGLHHVAIDVLNLEAFIDEISSSGWLLHPKSLKTIRQSKTAYLCRPGIPTLIEVQEREKLTDASVFVQEIMIPNLTDKDLQLFHVLGLDGISTSVSGLSFLIQGKLISIGDLLL